MDNFKLDITGEGDDSLAAALEIAFRGHNSSQATHFSVRKIAQVTRYYSSDAEKFSLSKNLHGNNELHIHHVNESKEDPNGHLTLTLSCSYQNEKEGKLPFPLDLDDAITFVKGWLKTSGDPGHEPDHDGDNGRAWRVFTDLMSPQGAAIVSIQAVWAEYGK